MGKPYVSIKQVFERIVSVVLIILALPFFLIIALVYLILTESPIFFTQRRIGIHGRIFTLYKFRTLKNNTQPLSQRKFWFGNFLRATSLDELPQILNVLKGDMAFIGPRPLPEEYLSLFSDEQQKRHAVLPGITGLAQVNGRNSLAWEDKFKYDIYYVNNVSFILDFTILVKTTILIFSFRKDVSLEEKRFTGNPHA